MALVLLPLFLLLSSFTVFAQELHSTITTTYPPSHSPEAAPPHHHHPHPHPHPHPHSPTPTPTSAPVHPPTKSPVHPPVYPPHHHHHHPHPHHSPSPSPAPVTVHPPTHPTTPTPTHSPTKPPTPTPSPSPSPVHVPAKPPTHTHYPPTHAPSPAHPPVPVVHPPVHPPLHPFPRSFVSVQGVVFVKSCKYAGVDTLLGATPVLDAVVKLQCNNTRYKLVQTAKTDKNGYFFIEARKTITTFGAHKCNVVLVSAPKGLKPSNLHGGLTGAVLRPEKPYMSQKLPFMLYTVGPLAFEPKCPY